jgi:ribosomal protein S18 acetylase RimI-like enzyme
MNEITIRTATVHDLEILLQFEQGVIAAERPFDSTLKKGAIHYYDIEGMIDNSSVKLVVAEVQSQVVGSGYCRLENAKPYLKHTRHGYLGFMYVVPEYRGRGINKLIIGKLANWARSENITELRLDVYHGNTTAILAYEKAGFSKHMIEMRLAI